MRRFVTLATAGMLALAAALPAGASGLEPASLEAIEFTEAELVVIGPDGESRYRPAELELLPTYRLETVTPWRERPAVFEGVLLSDLLAANGLAEVEAIRVTAENDYAVEIARPIWTDRPLLIATRVDGRAHSRRARGPLQFVFPMSDDPALGDQSFEANWVWMAARIEPTD